MLDDWPLRPLHIPTIPPRKRAVVHPVMPYHFLEAIGLTTPATNHNERNPLCPQTSSHSFSSHLKTALKSLRPNPPRPPYCRLIPTP